MAIRQSKSNFKIALIFMPVNEIRPPVSANGRCVAVDLVADELARGLARAGHDVAAYCALGQGQAKTECVDGVDYRRVATGVDRWFSAHHRRILRAAGALSGNEAQPLWNSPLWYRQFAEGVARDAAQWGAEVVHVMNLSQFVSVIRRRLPDARIGLHMHCPWLEQFDRETVERRIAAADLVLGCSDFIAAGVRRRFPALAARIGHVYNGVDTDLLGAKPGAEREGDRILFAGRLAPEKGVHVLLDAFTKVLRERPGARLELVGPDKVIPLEALLPSHEDPLVRQIEPYYAPGAYSEALRARVAALPAGSVELRGVLTLAELAPRYRAASVFAFPSVYEEPFGMPVVEAMAAGTPVIATRGGAFPEIIEDGRSGLLVKRSDVRGLADAILQLRPIRNSAKPSRTRL